MPKEHSNQETEIKLRVPDISALGRRLKQLRARKIRPRTHEFNTLFDTVKKSLYRRGEIVRMRIEQPAANAGNTGSGSGKATLTFKGPWQPTGARHAASGERPRTSSYKVKQEFEVLVADSEQMRLILTALGLLPAFRYEKFRTTYVFPGLKDVKIEFDETPIGAFLELEGQPAAIDRAASLLGYARQDYLTESYGALHMGCSRRRGLKAGDMLFTTTKKSR
jgi:adenylate cyclase, class 2